jgi:hypothetical protein
MKNCNIRDKNGEIVLTIASQVVYEADDVTKRFPVIEYVYAVRKATDKYSKAYRNAVLEDRMPHPYIISYNGKLKHDNILEAIILDILGFTQRKRVEKALKNKLTELWSKE